MPKWKSFGNNKRRSNSIGTTVQETAVLQRDLRERQLEESQYHTATAEPLDRSQSNNPKYETLEKTHSELTILKQDDDLKHAEVVIVVMGPTGAGKSRLIREASMRDVPVGDSLLSSLSSHKLRQC